MDCRVALLLAMTVMLDCYCDNTMLIRNWRENGFLWFGVDTL